MISSAETTLLHGHGNHRRRASTRGPFHHERGNDAVHGDAIEERPVRRIDATQGRAKLSKFATVDFEGGHGRAIRITTGPLRRAHSRTREESFDRGHRRDPLEEEEPGDPDAGI